MTSTLCSGSVGHGSRSARRGVTPGSDIAPIHSSALTGLGRDLALDLEVLALEVELSRRPRRAGRSRCLPRSARPALGVQPEQVELRREVRHADAEPQPAVARGRRPSRRARRCGSGARTAAGGRSCRCRCRSVIAASAPSTGHGGGQVAVRHHVVLGHEDPVEAGFLRHLRRLERLLPAPTMFSRRAGPGRGTAPRTSCTSPQVAVGASLRQTVGRLVLRKGGREADLSARQGKGRDQRRDAPDRRHGERDNEALLRAHAV